MERIKHVPNAGRTITGLRDTGYTLYTAVADIIDNCINAKAENVWVAIEKDPGGKIHVRIIDDGYGMDKNELLDAMKYGSSDKATGNDLGRFGLGLKTASTSVCRKLSVITSKSKNSKTLTAIWDLDLVAAKNDWLLDIGEAKGENLEEFKEYINDSGTMVCWDTVDRIGMNENADTDEISNQALGAYTRRLNEHLSLVFHRFLDRGDLSIAINGEELEGWDPFVLDEKTDNPLVREIKVQPPHSKKKYTVKVSAYIIPNKYEYSSEGAKKRARISNPKQGFYVYREDRVIISGNWLGMYVQEPHFSLARIEMSFPRELDELFNLDIKKSTLTLNISFAELLKKEVDPVRRAAEQRYRKGRLSKAKQTVSPHKQSQGLLNDKYDGTTEKVVAKKVGKNRVEITNANGVTTVTMPVIETKDIKELIEVVDTLDDGLFWEPALVNNRLGLRINRGHIYYDRVYVPNFSDTVTIQGIDSLLWALAKCEQEVVVDDVRKRFKQLRMFVSMTLRELAEELPEEPDD
jgi:Histidine kinase-, DNA gyrase B-, and HSP90-like ATPase